MSKEQPPVIAATVEHDGAILLDAAGLVAWLRANADYYGDGHRGGGRLLRQGAHDALLEMADSLQCAYIDACVDEVLDNWRSMP